MASLETSAPDAKAQPPVQAPTASPPTDVKPAASHKRSRSPSAHDAEPLGVCTALPLLLLPHYPRDHRDAPKPEADDQRRSKAPRRSGNPAHPTWHLPPGLTPAEKRLALPLLINERLPYDPKADASVFEALDRSVRSQLARLDAVFQAEGLTPSVSRARRSAVEPSGEFGPLLKFVSAKLMPFSLEVVADTVRQLALQLALPSNTDKTPLKTEYAKHRYYLRPDPVADGVGIPLLLRCAFRHVFEGGRMLGAWSGTGEWPEEMAEDQADSAPIREQGWLLVQRCPAPVSTSRKTRPAASSPPQCLVQTCLYVTPGLSDSAIRADKSYLDVLESVTAPSFQKLIDEREQMIENRVMDRMLQARARPPGFSRSSSL